MDNDVDHRKKRRNRTTHSCINCHTTKRKCDRKRPCQRCTQLGLTGLCVYEVGDPNLPEDPNVDEATRLRRRIAELEGVIRELKNKPHPRWTTMGTDASSFHTRSQHNRPGSISKKRKLSFPNSDPTEDGSVCHDSHDKDIVDLSLLPDGPSGSSVAVKVEQHGGDLDRSMSDFDMSSYEARYAFGLADDYQQSPSSDSPRMYRFPDSPTRPSTSKQPITPCTCECLSNAVAYHSVTGLEYHLRGSLNVLSHLRHSMSDEASAESDPQDHCSIYAAISRLQQLILTSTRPATPVALSLSSHLSSAQSSATPAAGTRMPLSVTVPVTFSESINNLPPNFNLRPPPSGNLSSSNRGSNERAQGSHQQPHTPTGMVTPPLSSHSASGGRAWETVHCPPQQDPPHQHRASSDSPTPIVPSNGPAQPAHSVSPALSSSSTLSSYAMVNLPPNAHPLGAVTGMVGMHGPLSAATTASAISVDMYNSYFTSGASSQESSPTMPHGPHSHGHPHVHAGAPQGHARSHSQTLGAHQYAHSSSASGTPSEYEFNSMTGLESLSSMASSLSAHSSASYGSSNGGSASHAAAMATMSAVNMGSGLGAALGGSLIRAVTY